MTRERSIRVTADADRPRPGTRDLCALRPRAAPRSVFHGAHHRRGRGGRRARSAGEGLAPGPRSPPLGDSPPPRHPSSPRGGPGGVPTEAASGEAPRVPSRIPPSGRNGTAPGGGAPGQPLPAGDWLLRRVVVAQRGREGAGCGS